MGDDYNGHNPVFTLSGDALMRRTIAALALVCLVPGLAPALEIVNLRPAYGANGVARKEAQNPKLVPGDVLWADFAIDGLKVDENGKVNYETILEFFDGSKKRLFEKKTPNSAVPALGGNRMPGDMFVVIGESFAPGKYSLKLTVNDNLAKQKVFQDYSLEVVAPTFAFVHVEAPALGLPGTPSGVQFLVTGFTPDAKKKDPNVEVTIRVLDANAKPVSPPVKTEFPRDIPTGAPSPIVALPVVYPIGVLNRPGQFYIDIVAVDKNANNKEIKLRLPFTVLDVNAATGGK
jgi:hypothetical protein